MCFPIYGGLTGLTATNTLLLANTCSTRNDRCNLVAAHYKTGTQVPEKLDTKKTEAKNTRLKKSLNLISLIILSAIQNDEIN